MVRSSLKRMWSFLQSYTTESLIESPILAPSGRVHHQFRLKAASYPHNRSKLSRVGPLELGKTNRNCPLLEVVLSYLAGLGSSSTSPFNCIACSLEFWIGACEADPLQKSHVLAEFPFSHEAELSRVGPLRSVKTSRQSSFGVLLANPVGGRQAFCLSFALELLLETQLRALSETFFKGSSSQWSSLPHMELSSAEWSHWNWEPVQDIPLGEVPAKPAGAGQALPT